MVPLGVEGGGIALCWHSIHFQFELTEITSSVPFLVDCKTVAIVFLRWSIRMHAVFERVWSELRVKTLSWTGGRRHASRARIHAFGASRLASSLPLQSTSVGHCRLRCSRTPLTRTPKGSKK